MKFKLLLAELFFISTLFAQTNFDTLSVKEVASGVVHYHIVENSVPWNLNVLKIDLSNPYISITSAKAFDLVEGGLEETSSMAARLSTDSLKAVGAINADFFTSTGRTTGLQVLNGEVICTVVDHNWSKIGFDSFNNPLIERMTFSGKVITKNAESALHGVNKSRSNNQLILFNKYFGTSTGTNEYGTELILQPLEGIYANDTTSYLVLSKEQGVGNAELNFPVLSGHGTSSDFLDLVSPGDTIQISVNLSNGFDKFNTLVSGFPQIVKDGENYAVTGYYNEGGSSTFHTDRLPRTAIGFSNDSTYLYFVVVDGRQTISMGMSLIELADFMIGIGVHTGLNLDGGGSSTFVVKDVIYNYPSDGIERKVGNALVVMTSEPSNIAELKLFPDSAATNLERKIQFKLSGKDIYGYDAEMSFESVNISFSDPGIGQLNNQLIFTPAGEGITMIIAEANGIEDTSFVNVENITGNLQLTSFDSIDEWFVTGQNIDTLNSTIEINNSQYSEGNESLEINYNFTYQPGKNNWLYLNKKFPLRGVPQSISIDAKSDGRNHSLAFVIEDENGEEFAIITNKTLSNPDEFETFTFNFSNPIKISGNAEFYFPVKIKQIALTLDSERQSGAEYSGTIYLDNLRISYDKISSVNDETTVPVSFKLYQNYPNPFNPSTAIRYSIPAVDALSEVEVQVSLKIYDILGREITTLVNETKSPGTYNVEFNASGLSSGMYFYKIDAGEFHQTKKMILLK